MPLTCGQISFMPEIFKRPDPIRSLKLEAFDRLLTIMDELRDNCPWDKKQTIQSLRHLTIEETYELADAIAQDDLSEIKKELGDILLHIVFYARIASENQAFDIADVIHSLCDKLVRRHPHIYGDTIANDEETVKRNWEQIKLSEGKGNNKQGVLSGVPTGLPALIKAIRIQEKARGVGFDWPNAEPVWQKVLEELNEFQTEITKGDTIKAQQEFGDLLFALVNYARFVKINPEDALEATNKKFVNRFNHLEKQAEANGQNLADMTLEEMDVYWNKAKNLGL